MCNEPLDLSRSVSAASAQSGVPMDPVLSDSSFRHATLLQIVFFMKIHNSDEEMTRWENFCDQLGKNQYSIHIL